MHCQTLSDAKGALVSSLLITTTAANGAVRCMSTTVKSC